MPKITIREIDNTGSEASEYLDYTVLVPGIALIMLDDEGKVIYDDSGAEVYFSGLITDNTQFDSLVPFNNKKDDLGYVAAIEFVKRGLSVYYESAYEVDTSTGEQILLAKSYDELFGKFTDKGRYDLRFITIGGLNVLDDSNESGSADKTPQSSVAALICAGDRGDAVAVLSAPEKAPVLNALDIYEEKNLLENSKDLDA